MKNDESEETFIDYGKTDTEDVIDHIIELSAFSLTI